MARKFQIKRGPAAKIPTLAQAEFGMTTDSNSEKLFIGNGSKNLEILLSKDLSASAVTKTGDHTMSGKLTLPFADFKYGTMTAACLFDVNSSRFEVHITNTKNGGYGALLLSTWGPMWMDSNGNEYDIIHEGNTAELMSYTIATAELV